MSKPKTKTTRETVKNRGAADVMALTPLDDPLTRKPRGTDENGVPFVSLLRAETFWAEQARDDPAFFIEYLTEKPVARHHRMWITAILHPDRPRVNLIAPRESAKTTIVSYLQSWMIGKSPLSTNMIVSVSASQSEARLKMIRSTIETNVRYRNVFPHIALDPRQPNTQQEFSVMSNEDGMPYNVWRSMVERFGSPKDPTLFVAGAGGKGVIGRRISGLLILDDIIDETMLKGPLQEQMYQYIMQTLIPCVKEEGKVVAIGTRWMLGDVPERLQLNPAWYTIALSAMRADPVTQEMRSYWPEYWSIEKLERKRLEMDNEALFRIMYLSDPTALSASLFTLEHLTMDLPQPLPRFRSVWIGTDLAVSLKQDADWTVYAAIGVDEQNNYYLLDMYRFKTTPDHLVSELGNFADRIAAGYGRLDGVVFENVAFQSMMVSLTNWMRPDIPSISYVPKGDKKHRASLISDLSRRGKFYINQRMDVLAQLQREWLNFPMPSVKDDTLDAVSICVQYLSAGMVARPVEMVIIPNML